MKILLSGATGFLGSALAHHWVAAGHDVTVLARRSSSTHRLQSILPRLSLVRIDEGRDLAAVMRSVSPDAIAHTACAYGRNGETPLQLFEANVAFGVRLLQGVMDSARTAVTFINTGTVLESSVSPYAMGKNQFAAWGELVAQQQPERLRFVNILLQHMYGPADDAAKFTTRVMHACYRNEKELPLTAGEQRRDLIYVDDVVSAYDVLLRRSAELGISDTIELGSGYAPTIRNFVETVHVLTGSRTELKFGAVPYRPNEAMLCQADTTRLRTLGWEPAHSLEQGIRKTIDMEFHT